MTMSNPLDRVYQEIHSEERKAWIGRLEVDSPVHLISVETKVTAELYVDLIEDGLLCLSNGKRIPAGGELEKYQGGMLFVVKPNVEDHAEYVARKLRGQLSGFPWRDLDVDQLSAVIKYAESKLSSKDIKNGISQ